MKANRFLMLLLTGFCLTNSAQNYDDRALWGSIAVAPSSGEINLGSNYTKNNNKVLITWRMLPGDDENTAFDLYRSIGDGTELCINNPLQQTGKGIKANCYQHSPISNVKGDVHYRLTYTNDTTTIGRYTMPMQQAINKVPYIEIPLRPTEDVSSLEDEIKYEANDCSVGDLDGDGQMEIVVKRLLTVFDKDGNLIANSEGAGDTDPRARHVIIWDAYKLDGTFLWRVKSGPNIIAGNSSNFAIADLDGDGICEMVTKTGEGTVFGDGYEIPDTDNDGKTDYRDVWPASHYTGDGPKGYGGPEFFSVIDGRTGKELARANFIARGPEGQTPAQWAANWEANDWKWDPRSNKYMWKLANSLRLGVAHFKEGKGMQIFLGRGVYGRTIVEGWDYADGQLTRMWKLDTDDAGGKDRNKDGKPYSAYAGQGNHAFNVADLDGDGLDEVMYGSCAFDDDGTGLWSSGLGHGDANHVGRFLPDREGLQVYHCLENGKTMVALHDAKDGSIIWKKDGDSDNDMGRCMVDDIDPAAKGCEFWFYGSNAYSQYGTTDLGYKPASCNMAIWFDGTLSRQLINEGIIQSPANGRTFTMYRYDMSFNNGSKSNPGWYGDMLGDWREEIILPDITKVKNLKLFSTWYPTTHRIPWLMLDHTYYMQCIHEQVGYNQPTHTGFYLGSDWTNDADIWQSFFDLNSSLTLGINDAPTIALPSSNQFYDLQGRRIDKPVKGLYIVNGKLFLKP